jgi:hypothetical protein
MTNIVDYVLTLKDNLSPSIEKANVSSKALETTMGSISKIMGGMGIAFAAYAAFNWLKDATKESQDLRTAQDEVKTGLISTKNAAGITFSEIKKATDGLFNASNFTKAQLMDMQSIIVTFPGITKKAFGGASQAIADMATRMHQDLKETAIQVGKALQDPVKGAMALHRVGVNLTTEQAASIKKMVAAGNTLGAQTLIMTELQNEFAGSAKAAYDSTPLAAFSKTMQDVKEKVGDGILALEQGLAPAFEILGKVIKGVVDALGDFAKWIKDNKKYIIEFWILNEAVGLAFLFIKRQMIATLVVTKAMAVWDGILSAATWAVSAATWAFSAALWSTGIPEIIIGVTLLVGGLILLYNHFNGLKSMILGVWDILNSFGKAVNGVFSGLYEILNGIANFSPSQMKKGLKDMVSAVKDAGEEIATTWGKTNKAAPLATSLLLKNVDGSVKPAGGKSTTNGGASVKTPATKAEGSKAINIHIAYNAPLIKDFTISTINVKEGMGKLKDMLTEMLTEATHDSAVIADY